MALTVTHAHVSAIPDDGSDVGSNAWNANHALTGSVAFSEVTGTISGSQLPAPTSSTLGGIESIASLSHNWVAYIDTSGVPHQSQPAFSDISGSVTSGQMPALTGDVTSSAGSTATTLANIPNDVPVAGDVLVTNSAAPSTPASGKTRVYVDSSNKVLSSKNDAGTVSNTVVPSTASSHQFATAISASGVVTWTQPAFTDISGSVAASQMPALTGDVTTSAGAVATTIANGAVTYAKIQNVANTSRFLGRITAGSGSIEELTGANAKTIIGSGDLTKTDDTNVTLTLGGTPAGALFSATSLTLGWTGTLALSRLAQGTDGQLIVGQTSASPLYKTVSGDATLAAGGALTIANSAVTNAKQANMNAWTIKMNNSGSAAAPGDVTIDGLTAKATPASTDEVMIWDVAGSAMKKATLSTLPAGAAVTSVATAYGLSGGTITSTGTLQVSITQPPANVGAPINVGLAVSAGSSALTIALKDQAGNDPSTASPCLIPIRSATATTGTTSWFAVQAATSLVISSGSTLGVTSSKAFRLWVVGFDGGSASCAVGVINCLSGTTIYPLLSQAIASSTAEGGAGAADSAQTFYTQNAQTNKGYTVLGYIEWDATGLTAGTWTTTHLTSVQMFGPGIRMPGETVQTAFGSSASTTTFNTTSYANSNVSVTMTLTSAANLVYLRAQGTGFVDTASREGLINISDNTTDLGAYAGTEITPSAGGAEGAGDPQILYAPNASGSKTYRVRGRLNSVTGSPTFVWPDATDKSSGLFAQEIMV